jgi:ABC-type antimicrobial peptide transport system permease subunit
MLGIGALVSMLSFGNGMHKNVTGEFQKMGLMRTMQIFSGSVPGEHERPLDRSADPDEPGRSIGHRDHPVSPDSSATAVQGPPLDQAALEKIATGGGEILLAVAGRELDRLGLPAGVIAAARDLGSRLLPVIFHKNTVKLTVVGTTDFASNFGFSMRSVLIPIGTSARVDHLSFSDPYQRLSMLSSDTRSGWPMLVVTVTDEWIYDQVRARIEAMGFHVFSFLDQFEQIRKSFLVFDALVGAIGFLAIIIASLSIVDTMVMSIIERTREIGILKSLGAEEGQIRVLFLVESAAIGLIGSVAGLFLGYGVSRLGAIIVRRIMIAHGGPDIDPFSLSAGIALGSIAFVVGVSLIAGLYPAARAALVDPVEALRQE